MKTMKENFLRNKKKRNKRGDKEVIKMIEPPIKQYVYANMFAYFKAVFIIRTQIQNIDRNVTLSMCL